MARLPVVGGDVNTWGTVLNDYLTEVANTAVLASSPSVGATQFDLALVPPGLVVGSTIVIDAYTTECEMRAVTVVSGETITIDLATRYDHASGDPVIVIGPDALSEWYGLVQDGSDTAIPLQRFIKETTSYGKTMRSGGVRYHFSRPLVFSTSSKINNLRLATRSDFTPIDQSGAAILVCNRNIETAVGTASDNRFTTQGAHELGVDTSRVIFTSPYGETLPGGIVAGRIYIVKTIPTSTTFTVSETVGGTEVTLSSDGSAWVGVDPESLARVFWESLYLELSDVPNLCGIRAALQQPSWTRNLRVEMNSAASSTTVSGSHSQDSATINVVATAGFPDSGSVEIQSATTVERSTVTYTGKTGSSFTGCGAHPAYAGGEAVSREAVGFVLSGQLSYHDNIEINSNAYTTAMKVWGSGHIVRGFNCNGVANHDTGVIIGGQWQNFSNVWLEQMGRCGFEFRSDLGNSEGSSITGSCTVGTNPATNPVIVDHGVSHDVIASIKVPAGSAGLKTYYRTTDGMTLLAWNGGTPAYGETAGDGVFRGYNAYPGQGLKLLGKWTAHPESDFTANRINDVVHVNTSSSNVTCTLPTAQGWIGWCTTIANLDGNNNVIIDPAGSETIGGAPTFTLKPGEVVTVYSDHYNYRILGHYVSAALQTYTPTNVSTDRAFDADTVLVDELADVVGTLIADLQAREIIG